MEEEIKQLVQVTKEIGRWPEFVQGGGGNASVKLDGKLVIKASGLRLEELKLDYGFVVLDYPKLKAYYEELNSTEATEQQEIEFIKTCAIEKIGSDHLRPSIETGFHALLPKFVLHTHSVYANLISCAQTGQELLKIFDRSAIKIAWIPYQHPGVYLALQIKKELQAQLKTDNKQPGALLIQNHGLIVVAETANELLKIHQDITTAIKNFFNLTETYPQPKLVQADEHIFESQTEFLKEFIQEYKSFCLHFDQHVLFPDQQVFCESFCVGQDKIANIEKAKIVIDTKTGVLMYHAFYKEALAIEETILAWAYIIDRAKANGLELNVLGADSKNYLRQMEMEKHRKRILN